MDGFDNAFGAPPAEVDPAAEFLAQEQEDLGGLGEDLGFSAPPVQNVEAPLTNGTDNLDFLAESEPVIDVKVEEDEIQVNMDGGENVNPFSANFEEAPAMDSGMDQMTTSVRSMRVTEEPECIKQWKIEQEEKLRIKDEKEEQNKEELKLQARKELDDWYKHYNEQLEKTKETNRNNQESFASEVAQVNDIQPGTEWERVAKHCDFNAKNTKNTKDVSRMRGIMLQLKQNPPTRD